MTAKNYKRLILTAFSLTILSGVTVTAQAEVSIEPKVEVQAVYTDNVELETGRGQDDLVLVALPGLDIGVDRDRARVQIDYSLAGYFSTHDTSDSEIRHRLNGFAEVDVVRDLFSVRVNGSVGQQFADVGGGVSANTANFTNNRRTVQSYSVNPRLTKDFGSFGRGSLNYTYGYSGFENRRDDPNAFSLFDSRRHRAGATFESGSRFGRINWTLDGFYDRVERENGNEFEAFQGTLDLAYALGRKIRIVGSIGYEDFEDPTLNRNEEGFIWDAGLNFTPNRRTEFEFRAGERFGDEVFSGSARYSFGERLSLAASYSEDIQVFGRGNIDRIGSVDNIIGGIPVDANGIPVTVGSPGFELTNSAFRQKRASLSLSRGAQFFNTSVTGFWERRRFSTEDEARISYGGSINLGMDIDRRQSVNVTGTYRNTDLSVGFTNDFYSAATSYEIKLSRRIIGSVRYIYSYRQGVGGGDLTENAGLVSVRASF